MQYKYKFLVLETNTIGIAKQVGTRVLVVLIILVSFFYCNNTSSSLCSFIEFLYRDEVSPFQSKFISKYKSKLNQWGGLPF